MWTNEFLRIHKRYEFDAPPASFVKFELFDLNCENHFAEFELFDLNCEIILWAFELFD